MIQPYFQNERATIYCGDWREVLPQIQVSFDLVLTDPPYGVNHDCDYTRFSGGKRVRRNTHKQIEGDAEPFDPAPLLNLCKDVILFGANNFSERLPQGSWLIWDKRTPTGSKGVMSDGEAAWWSRGHGVYIYNHTWDGFNRQSERGQVLHPSQKPVDLMAWCISRAKPTVGILDPYAGSGSVGLAACRWNLPATLIEKQEYYCAVAAERFQQAMLPLHEAI